MIRPSALQLAEHCGWSAHLDATYPTASEASDHGVAVAADIAHAIRHGGKSSTPEGLTAFDFLGLDGDDDAHGWVAETHVSLRDDLGGEVITEGTPDLWRINASGQLQVWDWKCGLQHGIAGPDDHMQLHAYAHALMELHAAVTHYTVALVFLSDEHGKCVEISKEVFRGSAEYLAMRARIVKAANAAKAARVGDHCHRCYNRSRCHSFMLPAHDHETALAPITVDGTLTPETARRLMLVAKALELGAEVAKRALQAYAAEAGGIPSEDGTRVWGPVQVAGKRSGPSVAECEAHGLGHLVKQGAPSVRYDWRKR